MVWRGHLFACSYVFEIWFGHCFSFIDTSPNELLFISSFPIIWRGKNDGSTKDDTLVKKVCSLSSSLLKKICSHLFITPCKLSYCSKTKLLLHLLCIFIHMLIAQFVLLWDTSWCILLESSWHMPINPNK